MSPRAPLQPRLDHLPLFAADEDLAIALLGPKRAREFSTLAILLEPRGFPKVDPMWGGRYTPAIKAYFDVEYGLSDKRPAAPAGVERPETWKTKKTG